VTDQQTTQMALCIARVPAHRWSRISAHEQQPPNQRHNPTSTRQLRDHPGCHQLGPWVCLCPL